MTCRILVADDHKAVRGTLRVLLESHEHWQVCGEATDGFEAVQKAAELQPDVVILDFAMPSLDGLRAAKQILCASPRVQVLMHTHYALAPLISEAKKIGVRSVVAKGMARSQLIAEVEALLSDET